MDDEDIKGLTAILGVQAAIFGLLLGLLASLQLPRANYAGFLFVLVPAVGGLYILAPFFVLLYGLYTDTKSWKAYVGNIILSLAAPLATYYFAFFVSSFLAIIFPLMVLAYLYLVRQKEWWGRAMLMNLNVALLTIFALVAVISGGIGYYAGLDSFIRPLSFVPHNPAAGVPTDMMFNFAAFAESCQPLTCQVLSILLWAVGAVLFGVVEWFSLRVASGYFPESNLKYAGLTLYMTVINLLSVSLLMLLIYALFP